MAAPPDFAMVREVRAKALKLQQTLRDLCSVVSSKETLLLQLHSAMALSPRYRFEKTESGGSARVIDVEDVVEKFSAFEKSVLENERLLQQQREMIANQQEEIDSLRWTMAEEENRCRGLFMHSRNPVTKLQDIKGRREGSFRSNATIHLFSSGSCCC